ncbi:MAG: tRNA pseudouridine(55) synthase TruB [Candidatus Omnitrophica bacterium]|nr:tRNA pseudouridine(55) synthase TruB [Candidatus Omnitrophota bacterium]
MNGIVIVDKPSGLTSHDVVLFFRRRFKIEKVGHAGTLDPMATGVLVLLLGKATKRSGNFITDDKEYEGTMKFGVRTDTHDREGKVLRAMDSSGLTDKAVEEAFSSFRGTINQVPPMVSAVRHEGRKLYELARKGVEVERKPRRVTIYDLKAQKIRLPEVSFTVHCSKGTYIRKLADDIGEKLGCGAHLTSLRRTRSGRFGIDDSVSFEELKKFDSKMLEARVEL